MTSIYSSISIETRLVTHFKVYKIIMLHLKGMLYVLNHDFRFFPNWNITKFCRSIDFALFNLIYQRNLQQIVYSLCFKKQRLELLLHLSFKAELPTNDLQDISFLVLYSIHMWKNCCEAIRASLVTLFL